MINKDKYTESVKIGWVKRKIYVDFANWKVIPLFGKNVLFFHMNIDGIYSIPVLNMVPDLMGINISTGGGGGKKRAFNRSIRQQFLGQINIQNKCLLFQN